MESEITLQVILVKPTAGVVFGLQKGSGSNYETVQKQIPASNDLSFTFTINVKGDRAKDEFPKFSGSFVQGPAVTSLCISTSVLVLANLIQFGRDGLKSL